MRLPLRLLTVLSHRGITHSLAACALAALAADSLVALADPRLAGAGAAGVAVGYGAHVAADACTPGGVPLWAPLSRRRVRLLPSRAAIPTGSLRETALAVLAAVLIAAAVYGLRG